MADTPSQTRRPLMAANWKMNKTAEEAKKFITDFKASLPANPDCDVVLCPPFTALETAGQLLKNTKVNLGAQNLSEHESGAYTGEISSAMIKSLGCSYVILGHSERRQYYGETDRLVNKKLQTALKNGFVPIVCIGETLEEREANKTLDVVARQLKGALIDLPSQDTRKVVLAYEPVWAIGTGKTATPAQAQEVHLKIRDILKDQYGSNTSLAVRILYGGSVKPDNIRDLMACEDIDGGLVGGASLDPASFLKLVSYNAVPSKA